MIEPHHNNVKRWCPYYILFNGGTNLHRMKEVLIGIKKDNNISARPLQRIIPCQSKIILPCKRIDLRMKIMGCLRDLCAPCCRDNDDLVYGSSETGQ